MNLSAGSVIQGKYRVESVLGVGGMGQVLLASHIYLQQRVAIKILLAELLSDQNTVDRFLREAQSTVKLRGEHIARVIDVGTLSSGQPFMVMEYLEGADLGQILHHYGPQPPAIVVDLMLQACEGLAEAHSMGIVHRDVKPANFFATRRLDGSTLLKILDFGISKNGQGAVTDQTGTQTILGTPSYMAPEQMRQSRGADARSDIWSLGIVMYQLLCGQLPFKADTFADLVIKACMELPAPLVVPGAPGLEHIVMQCLEKDPANRPSSATELASMLAMFAADSVTAQATVERCRRVSQGSISTGPVGRDTGRPLPLSIPALTPPSWSTGHSNPGSLTGAAGQMAGSSQRSRSYWGIVATVATIAVVIGIWAGTRSSQPPQVTSTPISPNIAPSVAPVVTAPMVAAPVVAAPIVLDARPAVSDEGLDANRATVDAPVVSSETPPTKKRSDGLDTTNKNVKPSAPTAKVSDSNQEDKTSRRDKNDGSKQSDAGKSDSPKPDSKKSDSKKSDSKKPDTKKSDELDFGSRN